MYQMWQQVPLETTWGDFAPGTVLLYNDNEAVVIDARHLPQQFTEKVKLRIQRPNGERFERKVKASQTLGQQAHSLLEGPDHRAMVLPSVIWQEDKLLSPRNIAALLVSIVLIPVFVMLAMTYNISGFAYMFGLIVSAAAMGVRRLWKGGEVTFVAPERLGLTMGTVHAYALTQEAGKLWVAPTPGTDRRGLAQQRVAAIRDAYLSLREDIVHRIETPALFDPKVPATAAFEAALVAFEDATDRTTTDELDELATEVELTFNVAQANAERVGLTHYPEHARADARRAGKAARLAEGATTEGERRASLTQVKRILDSLALYYLPTLDEKPAIEA